MGLTYATVQLTNFLNRESLETDTRVDTGATFLCVTEEIALQLGFDLTEARRQVVTLADGHQYEVPKITPIEVAFGNRSYVTEAVVIGDEPLLGVLPLEAMDLVIDPSQRQLITNPRHPNYAVALAKRSGFR
uniref:Clan AA aspartic protease, AF_0612 family n=1 Tax=Candidatus Kentrum sp. FM TaxID=2126340 RepID=A0A450TVV9_9GAMM|nr:MAG: clan AA aspartic protease, AF_0612 family [Candidatus Kentron sp. FM]VFJ74823.1 MAG: clan AA aspartic protease, AF_0612 family [Candidatus Kentron sp. FM]VFK21576.1 MAG: clan AA aspartic protease, AF_0612 family [Candidatus Kentron sp. FM]